MFPRIVLSAAVALILAGLVAFSQPPSPVAALQPDDPPLKGEKEPKKKWNHKVVRVTGPEAKNPAEVSVAINPTNPDHIIAVSIQGRRTGKPSSNYAYVSEDGGLTWKSTAAPNPDRRTQGDDAIAFGPDGTAHHTYIAFDGIRTSRPLRAVTGIFCSSSLDGFKWDKPIPIVDHINSVEPFEDKPYVAVDTSVGSPHRGNIYVGWTRFDVYGSKDPEHKSHIYFSRSRDGGRTFAPPLRISDKPGSARDNGSTIEGAVPAVGPKGEVYIAWGGPEGIVFDKSTDGGWSFGKDKVITKTPGGWDIPVAGVSRHNGMPVTGADISRGKNRGSIYVCWIDTRYGDPDVFLTASRDGGDNWSEPLRVNDDKKGNGKAQLFAWMAVDPRDGSVNIVFYDRRDLDGTLTGLTLARSVDGGRTFVNHKINQEPFACHRDVFFGDYIGISAVGGRVVAVYMHFIGRRQLALSAAVFRFRPGSQQVQEEGAKTSDRLSGCQLPASSTPNSLTRWRATLSS
jgi:hypothetical protein